MISLSSKKRKLEHCDTCHKEIAEDDSLFNVVMYSIPNKTPRDKEYDVDKLFDEKNKKTYKCCTKCTLLYNHAIISFPCERCKVTITIPVMLAFDMYEEDVSLIPSKLRSLIMRKGNKRIFCPACGALNAPRR